MIRLCTIRSCFFGEIAAQSSWMFGDNMVSAYMITGKYTVILLLITSTCLSACRGTTISPSSLSTGNNGATISFSNTGGILCSGFANPPSPSCIVTSYTENGFNLTVDRGTWSVRTDYGSPAPFIEFWAAPGTTVTGQVVIVATDGSPFYFKSVDLYSSTTPIPYTITGGRRTDSFTVTDALPNTFGDFRTVVSQHSADAIEHLSITLTNSAASCPACSNLMGLDSIVLTSAPTTPAPPTMFSLSGQVIDSATGTGISGALVSILDGPNAHVTTTTDATGNYRFTDLQESGFTVSVSATGYASQSKGVTLTASQTVSFQLVHVPPSPPPPAGTTIIGFGGLTVNRATVTSYTESGFTVLPTAGAWFAVTTYGAPAPSLQFSAPANATVIGEVRVSAVDGTVFSFKAVDVYSSTVSIPYQITGIRNGSSVFKLTDTVPSPGGNFKTVTNPNIAAVIDALSILLTNATGGVDNPMGVDNIVLVR